MKLVIVSDTHREEPEIPDGDVLIHCGDGTYHGRIGESIAFLDWFSTRKPAHKLLIAGNHELGWQSPDVRRFLFERYPTISYLHDSGLMIGGISFWGSPVQPEFHGWAFQKSRGIELIKHWAQIPKDVDVLITHGPPKGLGDVNRYDERFGDEDLLNKVLEIQPQIHCYGHAHHGTGIYTINGIRTKFINAAVLSEDYNLTKEPTVIEIDAGKH